MDVLREGPKSPAQLQIPWAHKKQGLRMTHLTWQYAISDEIAAVKP